MTNGVAMATEPRPKRTKMILVGSAIAVVGLVAAVALWLAGGSRRTDAVENLARAPIGCDTTLDFSVPGEYLIFVESRGNFTEVRGDCDASGDFEVGASRPEVDITVLDPDGAQVELTERRNVVTYSTGDFEGRSVLALDVIESGDHVMRVEAIDEAQFAVSVGRDPNSGVALLRGAAVLVGLAGIALGLLVALIAGRRRQPAAPVWTPAQPPGQWPPAQPPYQQPGQPAQQHPGQPPYQQPGQPPYYPPAQPPPPPGAYGQPGQYGSAPAQPQYPGAIPQPPPAGGAPQNPFAPPAGGRQSVPGGGVGSVPGQPPMAPGGVGDGAMVWPADADEDATPPRGANVEPPRPSDAPPTSPEVDRWDTSRQHPPD